MGAPRQGQPWGAADALSCGGGGEDARPERAASGRRATRQGLQAATASLGPSLFFAHSPSSRVLPEGHTPQCDRAREPAEATGQDSASQSTACGSKGWTGTLGPADRA